MKDPFNYYNSHYSYDPDGSGRIIVDLDQEPEPERTRIPLMNIVLFLMTVLSTVFAGAVYLEGKDLFSRPLDIIYGIPFSASILFILGAHEMGHYLMCRRHRVPATLPFFIPAPFIFGTMGAVIKIKGIMKNRKVLVDVGSAGPFAGMLAAVPVLLIGIYFSEVKPLQDFGGAGIFFGEPLLFKFFVYLVKGFIPSGKTLYLSSVGLAGWAGLFVTSLNLLPVGQLDGGHILYGVSPKFHAQVSKILILILIPLGFFFWVGWLVWAFLLLIIGARHPKPVFDYVPLDSKRRLMAFAALLLFVLTFSYQPIYFE